MPMHDWTRVNAGTFHAFHTGWILHLSETMNRGLLPPDYFALPEQWAGQTIADVLTLHAPSEGSSTARDDGGVAVLDFPPQVSRKLTASPSLQGSPRTLVVRHTSGDRIVAFIEIASLSNKDRTANVARVADKFESALWRGVNAMLLDILPPGRHDPRGMHAAIWERFSDDAYALPSASPLTLASYVAGPPPEAYVEHLTVGWPLKSMPLFLSADRYVDIPLDATYMAAFDGLPARYRELLVKPSEDAPVKQRDHMRYLFHQMGGEPAKEQIILAYASSEREGKVPRESNVGHVSPDQYARMLYADGLRVGWIRTS